MPTSLRLVDARDVDELIGCGLGRLWNAWPVHGGPLLWPVPSPMVLFGPSPSSNKTYSADRNGNLQTLYNFVFRKARADPSAAAGQSATKPTTPLAVINFALDSVYATIRLNCGTIAKRARDGAPCNLEVQKD
ncbi:hypothetical protein EDD11_007045 [Mortierella claussenii]|nr:hypothetical protein EDD11_007045 [Mortierella claussenii]